MATLLFSRAYLGLGVWKAMSLDLHAVGGWEVAGSVSLGVLVTTLSLQPHLVFLTKHFWEEAGAKGGGHHKQ